MTPTERKIRLEQEERLVYWRLFELVVFEAAFNLAVCGRFRTMLDNAKNN